MNLPEKTGKYPLKQKRPPLSTSSPFFIFVPWELKALQLMVPPTLNVAKSETFPPRKFSGYGAA